VEPIIAALAAGAAASPSGVASQAVKDVYAALKAAITSRFPQLAVLVQALEARPDSRVRVSTWRG
jgi:hypothetical protein